MRFEPGNRITSGIEPVDELLGGLDRGELYLVHGEASGKSLFGIKFLIEGLKQGENTALVIRYSPEDAVRRFARLGYDCLEDVYSGRLVILEYSDDIIQKIGKLRELTPVLRELEWLLGETRPKRLIFDPVASVLAGSEGNLDARAREFAEWARSFGATVVLIANESNNEIVKSFEPLVAESFRFDVREIGERAARFISFEKSPSIPDHAIEVDPSRGVFLLGRAYDIQASSREQSAPEPPSIAELESIREELRSVREKSRQMEAERASEIEAEERANESETQDESRVATSETADAEEHVSLKTQRLTEIEEREFQAPRERPMYQQSASQTFENLELGSGERFEPSEPLFEGPLDELSDLIDDITISEAPIELDLTEPEPVAASPTATASEPKTAEPSQVEAVSPPPEPVTDKTQTDSVKVVMGQPEAEPVQVVMDQPEPPSRVLDQSEEESVATVEGQPEPRSKHQRASDIKIDSEITARAVDLLLHPPDAENEQSDFPSSSAPARTAPVTASTLAAELQPKDFNILIVEDDPETRDLVSHTLSDYSLEVVHDGVSGLAKLISFKPDLVVLDFDLPVIDGFKVLSLIRSSLNVPIIIISGSRMRAIDRVMASELGADYYLTKPFSAKELKHKARQLIARYRGLNSWITNPSANPSVAAAPPPASIETPQAPVVESPKQDLFTPYSQFANEVETRVKAAMESGAPFSIVGCRLKEMTANGGHLALRLYDIVHGLARDADITSTNPRNDLVILLADAGSAGARAFAGRLRARVMEELNQDPTLWMRSFPDLEESTETAAVAATSAAAGGGHNRRSGDQAMAANASRNSVRTSESQTGRRDQRNSYIDFLEQL
jgi:CheY-like chemotaxis protein/KaiC/GvpD/RAD55 family RecA-like ATPase